MKDYNLKDCVSFTNSEGIIDNDQADVLQAQIKLIDLSARQLIDIKQIAYEGATTDGGHHKQYDLERILKMLDPDNELNHEFDGIAP